MEKLLYLLNQTRFPFSSRFILKQLDYSLSISMLDRNLELSRNFIAHAIAAPDLGKLQLE